MKFRARLLWIWAATIALLVIGTAILAIVFFNPRLTKYVESEAFRTELEKQTAKGLHFESGRYAPVRRTSFLTAETESFQAQNGRKAMRSIEAHGIAATFNPWGVFLRRWQLDRIHIKGGEVAIQTYEPKPEPSPAKPWYHVFLPQRVYLKRVESEPAEVTWRLRGERAGFFGTRLLITPHGRDFNYQATGGTLKMPIMPDLRLRDTHLLITKTLLTLYNLDLESEGDSNGHIHAEGTAGTREDKSVDSKIDLEHLPIAEWMPATWRDHVSGEASGKIAWRGKDQKLENAEGEASLRVEGGHLVRLPFLERIAQVTGEKTLEHLTLTDCAAELTWKFPKVEIKNLAIEAENKFRATGTIRIDRRDLDGAIEFGVAPSLLSWLPHPAEVFPRKHDGYLWTTVHLSGTLDAPRQDLSPRIMAAIKDDPGAALGLFFRQLGVWLKGAFGGD
jgi:hypothetical protein